MNDAERQLAEDRALRDDARAMFTAGVAQVRADLAARPISRRVADAAHRRARDAMASGIEIAGQSKGIIAGVAALLGLWLLRGQIAARLLPQSDGQDGDDDHDGDAA